MYGYLCKSFSKDLALSGFRFGGGITNNVVTNGVLTAGGTLKGMLSLMLKIEIAQ